MAYHDKLTEILPEELLKTSYTSPPEIISLAWYKDDAKKVLAFLYENKKIVLGGEVLLKIGNKLDQTWDYWNYDISEKISYQKNVEKSYKCAIKSIDFLSKQIGDDILFSIAIWSEDLPKKATSLFNYKSGGNIS